MSVTKEEAVKKLQMRSGHSFQHPDGAFIVRPSEKNPDDLSLTARYCVSIVTGVLKLGLQRIGGNYGQIRMQGSRASWKALENGFGPGKS